MNFKIRWADGNDRNFIYSCWLKGIYHGNAYFHQIPEKVYFKNYQAVIEAIIQRPNTGIKVACLDGNEDVILSYMVFEESTLHWIFTKEAWRNLGIAKALMEDVAPFTAVSHLTYLGNQIRKKKNLIYNPFIEDIDAKEASRSRQDEEKSAENKEKTEAQSITGF